MPISSHLGIVLKAVQDGVYRLALYQVLASLVFAMAQALQIIFVDYDQNSEDGIRYDPLCTAMGWLVLVGETSFHDVGDLSCILFCGIPQESEEA